MRVWWANSPRNDEGHALSELPKFSKELFMRSILMIMLVVVGASAAGPASAQQPDAKRAAGTKPEEPAPGQGRLGRGARRWEDPGKG